MSTQKQYAPKTAPQPQSPHTRYTAVPPELKACKQWVAWKSVPKPGQKKPAKVPFNPHTGRKADTTDASTWGTYAQAIERYQRDNLDGIGFVVTALDPFVGIDLDRCRDADTGEISTQALTIIKALDSYTELSPSGTGVRIFVKGKLPPVGRKKGNIEVYEAGRYLTVTGNHLDGTRRTIEPRQDELTTWHASVWRLNQANPLVWGKLGEEHAIPTEPGVMACNSSPPTLRSRFQSINWNDPLVYVVLLRNRELQKAIVAHSGRDSALVDQAFTHSNGVSLRFACVHEESRPDRPSADLSRSLTDPDMLKFRCHHRGDGGLRSRQVGFVDWYAWQKTGEYHDLSKAELKLWTLRLFVDMGLIDAPDVQRRALPDELPEDAPDGLRAVYGGIVERMRVQAVIGAGFVALTHKFLAHWCGVSEHAVAKGMAWLLKRFYLKGGVFLRPDGTFSQTRETERSPECFVLNLEARAWKHRSETFIQRTRMEWARYYAEKREMEDAEALYWRGLEEAEWSGELDEAIYEARYCAEQDKIYAEHGEEISELMEREMGPLDLKIMAVAEAMEGEAEGGTNEKPLLTHDLQRVCKCGCLVPIKSNQTWATPGCKTRVRRQPTGETSKKVNLTHVLDEGEVVT